MGQPRLLLLTLVLTRLLWTRIVSVTLVCLEPLNQTPRLLFSGRFLHQLKATLLTACCAVSSEFISLHFACSLPDMRSTASVHGGDGALCATVSPTWKSPATACQGSSDVQSCPNQGCYFPAAWVNGTLLNLNVHTARLLTSRGDAPLARALPAGRARRAAGLGTASRRGRPPAGNKPRAVACAAPGNPNPVPRPHSTPQRNQWSPCAHCHPSSTRRTIPCTPSGQPCPPRCPCQGEDLAWGGYFTAARKSPLAGATL